MAAPTRVEVETRAKPFRHRIRLLEFLAARVEEPALSRCQRCERLAGSRGISTYARIVSHERRRIELSRYGSAGHPDTHGDDGECHECDASPSHIA
jgi:hypothetical protein